MSDGRKTRGEHGPITRWALEDHGWSIQKIKEWREVEFDAGRPNGLGDFYAAHGLCFDCGSTGVQMIGWSKPAGPEEFQACEELGTDELPLYAVCPTCMGSGTAPRIAWKKSAPK
jgi:hypothetical protein